MPSTAESTAVLRTILRIRRPCVAVLGATLFLACPAASSEDGESTSSGVETGDAPDPPSCGLEGARVALFTNEESISAQEIELSFAADGLGICDSTLPVCTDVVIQASVPKSTSIVGSYGTDARAAHIYEELPAEHLCGSTGFTEFRIHIDSYDEDTGCISGSVEFIDRGPDDGGPFTTVDGPFVAAGPGLCG